MKKWSFLATAGALLTGIKEYAIRSSGNFKELRAFEEDLKAETTIEKNVNSETTKYRQIDILTDNDSTIEEKGLGPEITHNITLEEYEEAGRDIFKIIKSKEPASEIIIPKPAAKPEKPEIKRLQRKRSDNVTIKRATVKDGQITKITNDGMTTFLGDQGSDGRNRASFIYRKSFF